MSDADRACEYWRPSECEGDPHCPPRCPRFVDREGEAWVVRPAEAHDRDALVAMYDDFAPSERAQGLPPRKRRRIEDWLDDLLAEGCNFVVAGDDRVVGHAVYTPTGDPTPEFAVFVHQDYQHRGLGTELSKHVVTTAAVADRDSLELVVDPNNRVARALYETLDFEVVDRFTREGRRSRTGLLKMRRSLAPSDSVEFGRAPILSD